MVRRVLQVRRGESTRTILLCAYLFLVFASYIATKSARDALFLGRYSAAQLPYADIASGLTVAAVMAIYLRVARVALLRVVLIGTVLFFSATSLFFWTLSRTGEPSWMLPTLYVWAAVFGVLLPAQVWTLANYVLTTREAKRLFGVIGSGAIAGWIAGGLMTKAVATRLGSNSLLLITSVALAVCPVLVLAIFRQRRHDPAPVTSDHDEPRGFKDSLEMVWQSPHLRAIAGVVCLSSLVTTVTAWQFRAISKHFIPETDALTAFFGTFNICAGVLSLMKQLFLTSRLLRRFGLGVALCIVPLALTAGSLGLLVFGGIGAAMLLKGSDQVLRYSIDRSTVELLYLPVPERQTFHAKAFIDTLVWRSGDCLGAVLVLLGVVALGMTAPAMSVVTIVLLAAWLAAAFAAERYYVQNLRDGIHEHRLDAERLSSSVIDRSTSDVFAAALRSDNPEDILYALTLVEDCETVPLEAVQGLLDHRSSAVRRRAIAVLAAIRDTTVLARVEHLLQSDEDSSVRAEALLYLARLSDVDPLTRLSDLERVDDISLASAVAVFLARPGAAQNLDAVRLLLDAALGRSGTEGQHARLEAARLIASLPAGFEDQLEALLKDPTRDVARAAIRAVGALGARTAAPLVIARLGDSALSADAAGALTALGEAAVPALGEAFDSERSDLEVRSAIPDVLQRIGTPSAEQVLVEHLLDPDPILRLRTVSALNKLRQLNPERRLERELIETVLAAEILGYHRSYQILGKLRADGKAGEAALAELQDSMTGELERIFRLMNLLLPGNDLHSAYIGLRSRSAVVHANALEFLEHVLPAQLCKLLLPLLDNEVSIEDRIRIADRVVGVTIEASKQTVAAFAASDELLRDAARTAEERLGTSNLH